MLSGFSTKRYSGNPNDTVDLRNASCNEEASGTATCVIRAYNTGFRDAEVWSTTDGSFTQEYTDLLSPNSSIDNYQMKWDALSGDTPNVNTVAEGVWHDMSTGDFEVGWEEASAGANRTGSVTVSIRYGMGAVLDTAVWDGDAISSDTGK